jgi:two-component system response regulator HydG
MFDQELDRYWKTVVNTIRDGIMIVNTAGAIVSVNKAFEEILGYSREELIGESCRTIACDICQEILENDSPHWCTLFRAGSLPLRRGVIHRKDGTLRHVLKNAALLHDSQNHVIGAVETLTDITELIEKDNQIEAFRRQLYAKDGFHGIIGTSVSMQQVFDLIQNAAHSDAPVIVYGESGTGKELVSQAIHDIGERQNMPFVKVSCASLTESLLESELFGHVRGAFTGAYKARVGRFEMAHGGDIFLDEIGDLPLSTQVKLLRVLEEKAIERVGESTSVPADVRVISATNRDLTQLVEQGRFREDLYFRINVIPIHLPALRNRREDIPLIAEAFFKTIRLKGGSAIKGVSKAAMELLMHHDWPGNVRELKSAFEYAFVTCHDRLIQPHHFPSTVYREKGGPVKRAALNMKEIEKMELIEALEQTGGNQSMAAERLGVSRVTVWNRMKRHGIIARRKVETLG